MSRNRKFKKKMKNMLATVATLLLIIGVSVGVTLALLWGKTSKKENVFTGSKGVDVILSEEKWDGSNAGNRGQEQTLTSTMGKKIAEKYSLGLDIPKDPLLTNLSDTEDVWVMLRVQYLINAGDASNNLSYVPVSKDTFDKIATIQKGTGSYTEGINDGWFLVDGTYKNTLDPVINESPHKIDLDASGVINDKDGYFYYYCYKTKLTKDQATSTLFDNIHILNPLTLSETGDDKRYKIHDEFNDQDKYAYAILPSFKINVEGAAISWETDDPDALDLSGSDGTRTKKEIISELQKILDEQGNNTDGAN